MHSRLRQHIHVLSIAALFIAARSHAQIIPLVSEREIFAQVSIDGLTGGGGKRTYTEPDEFGPFNFIVTPHEDEKGPCDPPPPDICVLSNCDALAGQNSVIFWSGIQFSGEGAGSWDGQTSG